MHFVQLTDPFSSPTRNRSLSIRPGKNHGDSAPRRTGFSFRSLRGSLKPELSRRLFRLIKSQNNLISAHDQAGRERISIAEQLSDWGEKRDDQFISALSYNIGTLLGLMGSVEERYGRALDDARVHLKAIRDTEKSVQPSRDGKSKVTDDIDKLKHKEPDSAKLVILEQELVRAEAENLVAEAQLTNITRQNLKEAYEAEFAATIERAEKQIIIAKHGRRLLAMFDYLPVVPGDADPAYHHDESQAIQIANDVEDDLRMWKPDNNDSTLSSFSSRQSAGPASLESAKRYSKGVVGPLVAAPATPATPTETSAREL